MSLKIRRGTNAERLSITPAEGELIYTTDTKDLYVGDGSTVGGNIVTGYVGSIGGGYQGSVGYTGSSGARGATGYMGSIGDTGYQGSIGNVGYAGSTGLVGATGYQGSAGSVGYQGSAGADGNPGSAGADGNPGSAGSVGYQGSAGSVGYQGSAGADGNPGSAGSVGYQGSAGADGNPGSAGSVGYQGSAGSVGYQGSAGYLGSTPTGGTLTSDLDISTYSISNGSTLTINGTNGNIIATSISIENSINNLDNLNGLKFNQNSSNYTFNSYTDGTANNSTILRLNSHKGTYSNPEDTLAGEFFSGISFGGWHTPTSGVGDHQSSAGILVSWDSTADFNTQYPNSKIMIITGSNSTSPNIFSLNSIGTLSMPIAKVGSYATTSLPSGAAAEVGMILFDSTSNQFKGWNGTVWVVLG
jgi:hypothetical protein